MLSDDVLVEIFNFYVIEYLPYNTWRNAWHTLVHVCRRWRYLVFASPRRLNLRLKYGGHGPMSEMLDAWPVLPVILILGSEISLPLPKLDQEWNDTINALESENENRIREIYILYATNSRLERFAAAMQKPFPELTHLTVRGAGDLVPVLPDSFLGGSTPRLRELELMGIPFPSMPKLLLSANGLVILDLTDIPDSGYISPDAMATALTAVTKLKTLHLQFRSPRPRPDRASRPLPPPTRFVLPALTELFFRGVYEYLEDLLARIDPPLLQDLYISFFMDLNFDVPQLHWLIGHAEEFKAFDRAKVSISEDSIELLLDRQMQVLNHQGLLRLEINCKVLDWQLSSLAQVCSSSFPLISALEELEICEYLYLSPPPWKGVAENAQWLELLDPFTALKNLYLMDNAPVHVCNALLELSGERITEVLPALQNIFLYDGLSWEGPRKAIKTFVAARRRSRRPVSVHRGLGSLRWEDVTEDLASGDS